MDAHQKYPKPLHDLNNQLTIIQGYSDLLLESIPESDPRHPDLMEVVNAAKRAIELVPVIRKEMP